MLHRLLTPAGACAPLRSSLAARSVCLRAFRASRLHTQTPPAHAAAAVQHASNPTAAYPSLAYTRADAAEGVDASSGADHVVYQKDASRTWHLFDAKNQVVGRLAGRISHLLVGKHQPNYDPSHDTGDFVVVLNANHLHFTGKKWQQKLYRYHSGYVGGLKAIPAERWRYTQSARILKHAVAGMIHSNKLKIPRLNRLKVYPGLVHPHGAQFPFDIIAQVPELKAARDAELKAIAEKKQEELEATTLASSGGKLKSAVKRESKATVDLHIQGADDGTVPNDPDIKKAILKDREQRKGKPIVRL